MPLFQRPYVWKRDEQWVPLWEDISSVADRLLRGEDVRPHFLGAVVVDLSPRPTGHVECRLLIDGQQRLTTIQLLLEAFADACKALGAERHHRALLQYTRNDDPLSNDVDEVFKVWPTNADQEHFRRVMGAETADSLRKEYGKNGNGSVGNHIADCYIYFFEVIREWLSAEEDLDVRVDALFHSLSEHVRMVVIDLGPQDDAQLIFETLNARGTPLLPSDLVKNHLFHKAQDKGMEISDLYEDYWKPFDSDANFWRQERGRGHARRHLIDTYLMFFLILKTQDDVPAAHLYTSFKEWVDSESATPVEVLQELRHYGDIFKAFEGPKETPTENAFFRRLSAMDVVSAYPFLLELYALYAEDEHEQVLSVLRDLESWLVRRMVCQLSTRGYNRLFVDYIAALNEGEGTVSERFRKMLLTSSADSARWPTDAEFRRAWMEAPLYQSLVQARVRLLLEGIELKMRSDKSEDLWFGSNLPIEHLMPQSWSTHYPLGEDDNNEEATAHRGVLIHTMGNLSLLTQKLNSAVSNGQWLIEVTEDNPDYTGKRDEILKFSNLAINQMLKDSRGWTDDSIHSRGETLFDVASRIWHRPE